LSVETCALLAGIAVAQDPKCDQKHNQGVFQSDNMRAAGRRYISTYGTDGLSEHSLCSFGTMFL